MKRELREGRTLEKDSEEDVDQVDEWELESNHSNRTWRERERMTDLFPDCHLMLSRQRRDELPETM